MPLRYRKEIKLGDFIKLNINKNSLSLSAGVPGFHFNIGPQGPMINIDLPGGLSYRKYLLKSNAEQAKIEKEEKRKAEEEAKAEGKATPEGDAPPEPKDKKKREPKAEPTSTFPPHSETELSDGEPAELPPTPSRLNPQSDQSEVKTEELAQAEVPPEEQPFQLGFLAYQNGDYINAYRRFTDLIDSPYRSDALFMAGITSGYIKRDDEAVTYLGALLEDGQPPFPGDPDSMVTRYLPGATINVQVTRFTTVDLPLEPAAALLLYAEWLQLDKQLDQAAAVLEETFRQSPNFRLAQLSLADVYFEQKRYDDIYNLFAQHTPDLEANTDVDVEVMFYWAMSLTMRDMHDAADKVFRRALARKKGINPALRRLVMYGRADLYERRGKPALARKFFEKVLAEDPAFLDVGQRITELGEPQETEQAK